MAHSQRRPDPFYSSAGWHRCRAIVLKRDGYRCVVCGRDVSGPRQSRVDHIKPRSTHPHLELDPANCRTLCAEHDNQAHREKGSGGKERVERFVIRGCDADGWPLARAEKR